MQARCLDRLLSMQPSPSQRKAGQQQPQHPQHGEGEGEGQASVRDTLSGSPAPEPNPSIFLLSDQELALIDRLVSGTSGPSTFRNRFKGKDLKAAYRKASALEALVRPYGD